MSDVALAFLNTPTDDSKGLVFAQVPQEIQYPEPKVSRLKPQLHSLRDSPTSWQIHLTQILERTHLSQMQSHPHPFTGCDSSGNVSLIVMPYVDDLVDSGESSSVQSCFQEIQMTFSLKHIDYLSPDHLWSSSARVIKKRRSSQTTMEFSQKFIDNLLGLFANLPGSPQIVSRFDWSQKRIRSNATKRVIHCSGSTQRRHRIPSQGVVKIFIKSTGIRLRPPQASSQVHQSDQGIRIHHGASNSSPKFSRSRSS